MIRADKFEHCVFVETWTDTSDIIAIKIITCIMIDTAHVFVVFNTFTELSSEYSSESTRAFCGWISFFSEFNFVVDISALETTEEEGGITANITTKEILRVFTAMTINAMYKILAVGKALTIITLDTVEAISHGSTSDHIFATD